ncbi:MAG: DegT/DnrJ/EryC1/StrS family aminotransferase [Cyclonatronaceae bacterium]
MSSNSITSVELLDLKAQYNTIRDEIKEAVDRVLESQHFIMGPEVKALEQEMARYIRARHALGCASGSDALLLALMAIDIKPGDLVITSPYTFFATGGAIARLGAEPVFIDINPVDYNLRPSLVRSFLEGEHPLCSRFPDYADRVKAIIPVHLYGQCADMDPLLELAEQYDLKVIEDAAQAVGASYKHEQAGTFGDFGCFSFFPSKNLGAYGDGGLITVKDDALAEKTSVIRLHGGKPKYYHKMVGINSRLDAIQAAIIRVKLKYLEDWTSARRDRAMRYNRMFTEAGVGTTHDYLGCDSRCTAMGGSGCGFSGNMDKVVLPAETTGNPDDGGSHIYHQYVIRTGRRDHLMAALDRAGIGYAIYYPVPLHEQECFTYLGYKPEDCPASHCASRQTLALPIYPELDRSRQEYVVKTVVDALKS